jgi:hypothetical protein
MAIIRNFIKNWGLTYRAHGPLKYLSKKYLRHIPGKGLRMVHIAHDGKPSEWAQETISQWIKGQPFRYLLYYTKSIFYESYGDHPYYSTSVGFSVHRHLMIPIGFYYNGTYYNYKNLDIFLEKSGDSIEKKAVKIGYKKSWFGLIEHHFTKWLYCYLYLRFIDCFNTRFDGFNEWRKLRSESQGLADRMVALIWN